MIVLCIKVSIKYIIKINFTSSFLLFKMWLLENLKWCAWLTFVAYILFLLNSAVLENVGWQWGLSTLDSVCWRHPWGAGTLNWDQRSEGTKKTWEMVGKSLVELAEKSQGQKFGKNGGRKLSWGRESRLGRWVDRETGKELGFHFCSQSQIVSWFYSRQQMDNSCLCSWT